jgi:short-subunit dehydrogenase
MGGRFDGKVVFITGASSGIGAAAAAEFAREGAKVAIAARRIERLEELRKSIEAEGGTALAVACDVTRRESIDAAVSEVIAAFGAIDVVLANAGFGVSGVSTRLETADYRRQFDTNFFGLLDTVYATLPYLKASKGRLGLVGSVSGRVGTPASGPYTASKFAVVGFGECLYYDLADLGVSVTIINPGFVASEIRSINNKGELTGNPDPVPQFLVMPAAKAAKQIVRALYRRKPELLITRHAKVGVFLSRHFPRLTRAILRQVSKGRVGNMRKAKQGGQTG